ncbi:MAG: superoxide dismutase family protein [Clostridia bacterium]|nr:superoxide dismutase family protein [Clostridia bacterium]
MGFNFCSYIERNYPNAVCFIIGSKEYPNLRAKVELYQMRNGVLVCTEAMGLPYYVKNPFQVFAFHIHEGESCFGNSEDPFADAKAHYNPENVEHPYHAGDLPSLFSNYGYAWNSVLTDRFKVRDVIGKVMIIHKNPDDFTTQPSGDSGAKIACGKIERAPFNALFK